VKQADSVSLRGLPFADTKGSDAVTSSRRAEAVSRLFEAYFDRVYAYLRYRASDQGLAEDLAVEVFARAWQKWRDVKSEQAARSWLFVTARNLLIDYYRSNKPTIALDALPVDYQPRADSIEETAIRTEQSVLLRRHLAALEEREREVIGLRFAAGLHNREIAPIIGTSEGNVAKILFRTLRKLRVRLEQEAGDV
jgi:RNA polymerase sigma-70 factor (ECF subfamily)